MRPAPLYLALVALAIAVPAAAQYSGGPGMRGGGMRGRGGEAMDPAVLQGPPAPAEFAQIVKLPEDSVVRYKDLYDRFMAATQRERDSLQTLRSAMRQSFEDRDRAAIDRQRALIEPLTKDLQERQTAFDDAVHGILDKSQWDRYRKWKDDERKRAEKERQDRWHRRDDGNQAS